MVFESYLDFIAAFGRSQVIYNMHMDETCIQTGRPLLGEIQAATP